MSSSRYISYSGFKTFLDCPRAYYHKYILRTTPPKPDNRVHMLYGDVVGRIFERFYVDKIWTRKVIVPTLVGLIKPTLNQVVIQETSKGGQFNWKEKNLKDGTRSLSEIENEIEQAIPRGIRSIKKHRLVSHDAGAEVVLDTMVDGCKVAGRADFVMRRPAPNSDLVIVDGKGSRWRADHVNNRQLRWYALLYWLKTGVIPDRLGFLYWRFEPEESMDWFEVTQRELEDLQNSILTTVAEIETAKTELVQLRDKNNPGMVFWANPGSACKLCSYQPLCPEGTKAMSSETKSEIAKDRASGVEDGEISF
jgi:hypothetical protein